jgi:hypothetical protein
MEWTHGGSSHLERSVPQTKDPIIFPGKQEVGIPLWIFFGKLSSWFGVFLIIGI